MENGLRLFAWRANWRTKRHRKFIQKRRHMRVSAISQSLYGPRSTYTGGLSLFGSPRLASKMADGDIYDEPDFTLRKKAPLPLTHDSDVYIEGFLQKLGRIFKGWKRRWFVLSGGKLYYYKNEACTRFGGELRLDLCDSVTLSNASHLGAAFQIKSKSRSFTLAAATDDKRKEWMNAINKGISIAKHVKPSQTPSATHESPTYAVASASQRNLPTIEETSSPYSVPEVVTSSPYSVPEVVTSSPYSVPEVVVSSVKKSVDETVTPASAYAVVVKERPIGKREFIEVESKGAEKLKELLEKLGEIEFTSNEDISVEKAEASFNELRQLVESVD
ncbi:pleckstrin-2-like isoform X2 [Corticium candelabrum]|uniref:pleckstrin-2-like isoform X2 n=1 Tax=Corticium candelabrum TaxID=121492 RepID=UPI002E37AF9E|nr:pleckstrin-2-like isoform X2 [Corticium candelabrum]